LANLFELYDDARTCQRQKIRFNTNSIKYIQQVNAGDRNRMNAH